MQCVQTVVVRGATACESRIDAYVVTGGAEAKAKAKAKASVRGADRVGTLKSIRRDEQLADPLETISNQPSKVSRSKPNNLRAGTRSENDLIQKFEVDEALDDSDDDLEKELARTALAKGTEAFEAQDWEDAESFLQDAFQMLEQLPTQERTFCDDFALQYKLAVCAYQTQNPQVAEEALTSLLQQPANSNEQRKCLSDAEHLLSHLYIQTGEVDRARTECEKALQIRRRVLGKKSEAALESIALMAHIYTLLNNRARAKTYVAMIPEEQRDDILKLTRESLNLRMDQLDSPPSSQRLELNSLSDYTNTSHLDSSSSSLHTRLEQLSIPSPPLTTRPERYDSPPLPTRADLHSFQRPSLSNRTDLQDSATSLTRPTPNDVEVPILHTQSRFSDSSSVPPTYSPTHGPRHTIRAQSPSPSRRHSHQSIPYNSADSEDLQSVRMTSVSSTQDRGETKAVEQERSYDAFSTYPEALNPTTFSPGDSSGTKINFQGTALTRKEILDNIKCQPRDHVEEAVCKGDYTALINQLNKRKDSWRSKLRKRGRSERVTALHFAALFGEIEMARRLLESNFDINEVPYGYTTSLTPLKLAIGARQVQMVEFLTASGAAPSEPETWSILAGQLLNRSWLMKTMSESEKEFVSNRVISILAILLQRGWDINTPFEKSGGTVLHQAVTFWTGQYKWDLHIRTTVTSFLCQQGANPYQANKAGKTPYGIAEASGHQDLLQVLVQGSRNGSSDHRPRGLVELPVNAV